LVAEPRQGPSIKLGPLRLDQHIPIPADAQPFQVLVNSIDEFRPAAAGIEILDTQFELAAAGPRMGVAQCSREGMPKMEQAGWRRGETCDLQDSLHRKAGESGT
jgi:hypothetical protein